MCNRIRKICFRCSREHLYLLFCNIGTEIGRKRDKTFGFDDEIDPLSNVPVGSSICRRHFIEQGLASIKLRDERSR